MTGFEAWSFVAPILALRVGMEPNDKDIFTKVYVTIFQALKEYDERRENHDELEKDRTNDRPKRRVNNDL